MAEKIKSFSDRSIERIGKTVRLTLGEGGANGVTPFVGKVRPTYLKIVSNEFDAEVGEDGTNIYTVDSYCSPITAEPLAEDVLAINLADIGKAENEVIALAADTWVRVIDMLYINETWYLVFQSGSGLPAPGEDYQVLMSIGGNWVVEWPLTHDTD